MRPLMDMVGKRVHTLEVVARVNTAEVLCRCDCGNERIVRVGHFNAGNARSCGLKCPLRPKAPAPKKCMIQGCTKPECNSHGWCWMHYARWRRHGDPLFTTIGKPQAWLLEHVGYVGPDCLPWRLNCSSADTALPKLKSTIVKIMNACSMRHVTSKLLGLSFWFRLPRS